MFVGIVNTERIVQLLYRTFLCCYNVAEDEMMFVFVRSVASRAEIVHPFTSSMHVFATA